jgi:hypothetical protein
MILKWASAHRALALSVFLLSCSSGSTGPTSGFLKVNISPLSGEEGALLFSVRGGPVESVEAVSGAVHSAHIDANTVRVVLIGIPSSGSIARLRIADISQASHYSAEIGQVAARATYALRDPAGYSITLAP